MDPLRIESGPSLRVCFWPLYFIRCAEALQAAMCTKFQAWSYFKTNSIRGGNLELYSSLTTFWSRMWSGLRNIFFNPVSAMRIEHPYNVANVVRWDAMSKGGMKVDHPRWGWLATCHSSSWYSFMHGRLVDNIPLVVEEICAVDLKFGHSILLDIESAIFCDTQMSAIDVNLVCGVLISHRILNSDWIWYSLLLELKITALAWHWDLLSCLWHWAVYSLQVMRIYSWKLLDKSLS